MTDGHVQTPGGDPRERLQKIMAAAGLGSRRGLEKRIEAGEIRHNREIAELGGTAGAGDMITIDGSRWKVELKYRSTGR